MIRSTVNESISSLSKRKHSAGSSSAAHTGVKGQGYELAVADISGNAAELRDEFDPHSAFSDFPSNAFNGAFE